jgi:quinol monooxygenase YgiN
VVDWTGLDRPGPRAEADPLLPGSRPRNGGWIALYATIPIDPDRRDEAVAAIDELVDRTNEEPATFEYRGAADLQEPNTIRLVEQSEDVAAHEAHAEAQHYREFVERLPAFLDGGIRAMRFDVDSVTALDVSVGPRPAGRPIPVGPSVGG